MTPAEMIYAGSWLLDQPNSTDDPYDPSYVKCKEAGQYWLDRARKELQAGVPQTPE